MSSLFMLDTAGNQELLSTGLESEKAFHREGPTYQHRLLLGEAATKNGESNDEDVEDGSNLEFFGIKLQSNKLDEVIMSSTKHAVKHMASKAAVEMDEIREQVSEAIQNSSFKKLKVPKGVIALDTSELDSKTGKRIEGLELRKPDPVTEYVQHKAQPMHSRRMQHKLNRIERAKTKGSGWFNMPATELTKEVRDELKVIQMRSVLHPKHFYKKNDLKGLPKYFQIGTVERSPLDYYSERHTRKAKKSLVNELLEDEAFQKFNKRKYNEVIERTDKYAQRKAMKKMKKLKKHK